MSGTKPASTRQERSYIFSSSLLIRLRASTLLRRRKWGTPTVKAGKLSSNAKKSLKLCFTSKLSPKKARVPVYHAAEIPPSSGQMSSREKIPDSKIEQSRRDRRKRTRDVEHLHHELPHLGLLPRRGRRLVQFGLFLDGPLKLPTHADGQGLQLFALQVLYKLPGYGSTRVLVRNKTKKRVSARQPKKKATEKERKRKRKTE